MSGLKHPFALMALVVLVVTGAATCMLRADEPTRGVVRANSASGDMDAETARLRELARRFAEREPGASSSGSASTPAAPEPPSHPDNRAAPAGNRRPGAESAGPVSQSRQSSDRAGQPLGEPGEAGDDASPGTWRLGPSGDRDGAVAGDNEQSGGGTSWVLQTLMSLGVVIGLILLLRAVWMRLSGQPRVAPSTPIVEVLSRTAVAPRNHILLLRIGHRILIVGDSGSGMRTLASVEDEHEVADLLAAVDAAQDNSISRNFQHLLGRFGASHEQGVWDGEEDGRDNSEHFFDRARNNVSGLTSRIRMLSGRKGGDL